MKQYDGVVKKCISFGQTKDKFKDIFTSQMSVETMKDAFEKAVLLAKPGDVVLLCPACSSFDQFKNYEIRGEIFNRWFMRMQLKGMKNDISKQYC